MGGKTMRHAAMAARDRMRDRGVETRDGERFLGSNHVMAPKGRRGPSKAQLRAAATGALEVCQVRRMPTKVRVKCLDCDHRGTVAIELSQAHLLKCSKCGSRGSITRA